MSSTQRSEGLNHYFKGFLNTHTGLVSFAQQYHMALAGRVEVEKTLNAKSMDRPYSCTTSILVEEVFIEAYTNKKFKEVKEEVISPDKLSDWNVQTWLNFPVQGIHKLLIAGRRPDVH